MKMPLHSFLHLAGVATAVAALSVTLSGHGAWSQTPRTIRIVVPVSPGGVSDFLARVLAEQVGRSQGQTVLIENRPGAGGVIAAEGVSRAAPDGNTLLMFAPDLLISPYFRKLNFDPLASFEPVCSLVSYATILVVNNVSPYHTLSDLLNGARANPGGLTLASFGPATVFQMAFESLKRVAHVDMTFVPYPGNGPAVNGLLGGHVNSAFTSYSTVAEQLNAGMLRALATGSRTRIELLPDIPTIAESGYKDYEVDQWLGLVAPAKTPKTNVSQLAALFTTAMQSAEVKVKLATQGLYPVGLFGANFGALLREQYVEFGRLTRAANIKVD
jgi:tripartite-type tricarboxylate transporter receptor subunit TctC